MKKDLTRRQMMSQAGLALGGVVGLGVLHGCGSEAASSNGTPTGDTPPVDTTPVDTTPTTRSAQVADFPYQQHLPAGYRLDAAPVREAAYQGYFAGGCCHGAYSALVGHLATTAGAPFNLLPLDFGKFGGGGIASYGSICGALLGSVLVVNMVVANANARAAMMTDLMRWYEGSAFPSYAPAAINAGEAGTTLDFSAGNLPRLQVVPGSHLCHASVSTWCARNAVNASGSDKKARCARLTADVAGRTAEMLNAYLASGTFAAAPIDATSSSCLGCHPAGNTVHPVAAAMQCGTCHSDQVEHLHP